MRACVIVIPLLSCFALVPASICQQPTLTVRVDQPTPPSKESKTRVPELDGIRGLAILGFMCSHGAFLWPFVILRFSEKMIARICIIGLFVALPLRILLYHLYFGDNFGLAQLTSSRVDGLFLGASLCDIYAQT